MVKEDIKKVHSSHSVYFFFLLTVGHCLYEWHPNEQTHTYLSPRISSEHSTRAEHKVSCYQDSVLLQGMFASIEIISGKTCWGFPLCRCSCFSMSFRLIFWITPFRGIQRCLQFTLTDRREYFYSFILPVWALLSHTVEFHLTSTCFFIRLQIRMWHSLGLKYCHGSRYRNVLNLKLHLCHP